VKEYLLTIDQGTTGTTVLCIDSQGAIRGRAYAAHTQYYPRPGWVEHDPDEIMRAVETTAAGAMQSAGINPNDLIGVGIANQRETVALWDARTGAPVDRAIVWQCRRTTEVVSRMRDEGLEPQIRAKTGLLLDPYFSAAKISWLLDAAPGRREAAERGEILAGTIDSWLAWKLSGAAAHVTDTTNASRTSLMNLETGDWDDELLEWFRVPRACLPKILPSAGMIAPIRQGPLQGASITGMAGDQQAALFGHRCCSAGQAKNTYGTGCFLLVHTGPDLRIRDDAILTTAACGRRGQKEYAWEGSVFAAGAVVQWLRDEVGIINTAGESEALARQVPDSGGVVMVPAFTGLGAPYWDPNARAAVLGLTRGSNRTHLARAALNSIALQTVDLVQAITADGAIEIDALNVDGGATENDLLMQIQADLLNLPVLRAQQRETTALGAAFLAGIGAGHWSGIEEIPPAQPPDRFDPQMPEPERRAALDRWRSAVQAVRLFGNR